MELKLRFSPDFQKNLRHILDFYTRRNKSTTYARKLKQKIYKEIFLLAAFPQIGRQTTEKTKRVLFVDMFCIEYVVGPNHILIVNIFSTRTDPATHITKA